MYTAFAAARKPRKESMGKYLKLSPNMNLSAKLSVAAIYFFPLIAGQAGTPEKATIVEQPPVTEPCEIKLSAPDG